MNLDPQTVHSVKEILNSFEKSVVARLLHNLLDQADGKNHEKTEENSLENDGVQMAEDRMLNRKRTAEALCVAPSTFDRWREKYNFTQYKKDGCHPRYYWPEVKQKVMAGGEFIPEQDDRQISD